MLCVAVMGAAGVCVGGGLGSVSGHPGCREQVTQCGKCG